MMSKKKASANDTMATTEVLIDRYNRSLSLSSGMSDNEMRQLIADFDNRYLNNSEKREMKELDENMEAQIEKSRKYSGRMIVNSASIALGGPIGAPINAIKMISNSHQYYKSEQFRYESAGGYFFRGFCRYFYRWEEGKSFGRFVTRSDNVPHPWPHDSRCRLPKWPGGRSGRPHLRRQTRRGYWWRSTDA